MIKVPVEIDLRTCKSDQILQGYLSDHDDRVVRLRQKGDKWFRTQKTSTDNPAVRVENEVEITKEEFLSDWPKTEGRRIEKTRHYLEHNSHTIELDVFSGKNVGNIMAEVEFATVKDAEAFAAPSWFGRDVTKDGRYSNSDIAKHGFPKTV